MSSPLLIDTADLEVVRKLLRHSWVDINFDYDKLTDNEKRIVDRPTFGWLARWARGD